MTNQRHPPMTHTAVITGPMHGRYWWTCPCGDEGGPYETWEHAWDATVEHEKKTPFAPIPEREIPF